MISMGLAGGLFGYAPRAIEKLQTKDRESNQEAISATLQGEIVEAVR